MKIYQITVMLLGLMFLFNLMGINTTSNQLMNAIGGTSSSDITSSQLFTWLAVFLGAIGLVAGAGIFLGQYAIESALNAVVSTFIGSIYLLYAADFYSIIKLLSPPVGQLPSWEYYVAWALIVPLIAGIVISVVEFIQGKD